MRTCLREPRENENWENWARSLAVPFICFPEALALAVCPKRRQGGFLTSWKITHGADGWAKLGIVAQLIVTVRVLAEYYRLRHAYGPPVALFMFQPYIFGMLINAVQCLASVILFFLQRYAASAIVSAITIALLIVYKVQVIGGH